MRNSLLPECLNTIGVIYVLGNGKREKGVEIRTVKFPRFPLIFKKKKSVVLLRNK